MKRNISFFDIQTRQENIALVFENYSKPLMMKKQQSIKKIM